MQVYRGGRRCEEMEQLTAALGVVSREILRSRPRTIKGLRQMWLLVEERALKYWKAERADLIVNAV